MCFTRFCGDSTRPSALPCSGNDALVGKDAAAPKSCLSLVEMHATIAAGGLLPTGKTSTATTTTFDHSTLWFCQTEETILRTSTPSASYDSSFWRNNLLAALSCRRVIETKSGQNRMFDAGGHQGCLRACSFLGTWRALLYGASFLERMMAICSICFWRVEDLGFKNLQEWFRRTIYAVRISVDSFSPAAWLTLKIPCQTMGAEGRLEVIGC